MTRLATIDAWVRENAQGLVLNLGCKETPWGTVRVDSRPETRPTVVADARRLPFREGVFGTVLFANVLEELPGPSGPSALREIGRVLRAQGLLLLTASNGAVPRLRLDPESWLFGYHYPHRCELLEMLSQSGFDVSVARTFGDPAREMFYRALMYAFVPFRLVTGHYPKISGSSRPDSLLEDETGFTHLVVGIRKG